MHPNRDSHPSAALSAGQVLTLPVQKLLNFVLFQLGWFACVLGAAARRPLLGCGIALLIIGWHLWRAPHPARESSLLLLAMLVGGIWDSLLVWLGLLQYPVGMLLPGTAPYWIVVMWALFASTLNLSLRWLKQYLLLSILLGAVAGPIAYLAGARLGALSFTQPVPALMILALGWAVVTPLLLKLSSRFDGYAASARRYA